MISGQTPNAAADNASPTAASATAQTDSNALPSALSDIRADHLSISVEDLDREIAWYGRVLGFKESKRRVTPAMTNVNLRNANFRIDLIKYPGSKRTPADPVYLQQGFAHLAMTVPDLQAARTALVALGADVKSGTGAIVLRDPEGNEIEIFPRN